ncbi:MAG: hypothetical protein EPO20_05850 [Betaproteobacteria bacterium]|nr:MAG: hypothetical protein EPO20_05850 [Betaproteobacteria bacterium]
MDPIPVPVEACSRRHFRRSSPVSVSQRPLERVGAELLVAPLAPTLGVPLELVVSEERGAVVPAAPALSALVPVEGGDMPRSERMIEPDWLCANVALESATSAAAVAMKTVFSSIALLL